MAILLKATLGLATFFGAAVVPQFVNEPDLSQPQTAHQEVAQAQTDAVIRQQAMNAAKPPSVSFAQIFPHR